MRRALATIAIATAVAGCDAEPLIAEKGLAAPAEDFAWGVPTLCRDQFEAFRVPKTERWGARTHGLMRWNVTDGLRLDVDRYGTIAEIVIRERVTWWTTWKIPLEPPPPPPTYPIHSDDLGERMMRMEADVTSVWQGSAPLGPARFPAATQTPAPGVHLHGLRLNPSQPRWFASSWTYARTFKPVFPLRGLLFLPVERLDDSYRLGCVDGHIVFELPDRERQPWTAVYIEDVRLMTAAKAAHRDEALATAAVDHPVVRDLARHGHASVGYWLAEHLRWDVALALLESSPHDGLVDLVGIHDDLSKPHPFAHGLFEGIRRMLVLSVTDVYPLGTWSDVDRREVARRLEAIVPGAAELRGSNAVSLEQKRNWAGRPPPSYELLESPELRKKLAALKP